MQEPSGPRGHGNRPSPGCYPRGTRPFLRHLSRSGGPIRCCQSTSPSGIPPPLTMNSHAQLEDSHFHTGSLQGRTTLDLVHVSKRRSQCWGVEGLSTPGWGQLAEDTGSGMNAG